MLKTGNDESLEFKHENYLIPRGLKKCAKLDVAECRELCILYGTGLYTLRELGTMYGVSRTTVNNIVNNKCRERVKEYQSGYRKRNTIDYDKAYESLQRTKLYKKELYVQGKLIVNPNRY